MMSQYELIIKCKSCREELHDECSSKQKSGNYNAVKVKCTCNKCEKVVSLLEKPEKRAIDQKQKGWARGPSEPATTADATHPTL